MLRRLFLPHSFSSAYHKLAQHKPYYITTPIFYPNAKPHIGHLYTLVIGDVFARYRRLLGKDVKFLAGTDEHGLKVQKAARAWSGREGAEKNFCDTLSERFRNLAKKADISNTCFMRTSDAIHHRAVQDVWQILKEKNLIYKSNYSGWYSVTDECFYTDSQVDKLPTGTVSIETGAVVEWTSEENYMFRLSTFRDILFEHYSLNSHSIHPPQYRQEVLQLLHRPLADISISRPRSRLSWGVQVPGDVDQTVYVWFDALLIYLTGAGYPWPTRYQQEQQGWPADLQIIGKDILRFHAIYLPAILAGLSSIPFPHQLLAHAHWTVSQKKMSKSLGNVADPLAAMEKWGVDGVRFYLLRLGGRWRDDVDWSEDQVDKHVREIQSQLGNYFMRITSPKLVKKASSLTSPSPSPPLHPLNAELIQMTQSLPLRIQEHMDALEAGEALNEIMSVLKVANRALSTLEPWSSSCPDTIVYETFQVAFEMLKVVSKFIGPFMPGVGRKLEDALGKGEWWTGDIKGVRLF